MSGFASGWQAGAAIRPFPIAPGTPMAGYMARSGPATGTLDPLTIGAIVLRAQGEQVVIVTADLAGIDEALVSEIAGAAGLPSDRLMLCASHTHSGPAGVTARLHPADDDQSDPALRAAFVATCAETIAEAERTLESVDLVFGQYETAGVAANRNNPAGPYDSRVTTLATRRRDGSYQAVIVHFACHPTILGAESRVISSEFPGVIRRDLQSIVTKIERAPAVLYVNGAAGDISTRFTRQSQDVVEVERVGSRIARAAQTALNHARPLSDVIRLSRQQVHLPDRLNDSPIESFDNETVTGLESAAERRIRDTKAQGAVLLDRLRCAGSGVVRTSFDLTAWSLGELVLVAIPGELFASLGLSAVATSTDPALLLGYTNGYVGYLADRAAYGAETYEAQASPYALGSGEHVVAVARALLQRLQSNNAAVDGVC